MIRDRFAGADAQSLRAVKQGQGKIVERNGAKVAAYRAEIGDLHAYGMHGRVERSRKHMGLSLPRLALQADR
jgi:hypothetical protein